MPGGGYALPGTQRTGGGSPAKRSASRETAALFNVGKGGGHPGYAAYPAGNIRRRPAFAVGHQPHQEDFAVFRGYFHVRGFDLIGAQELRTHLGGNLGIRRGGA